MNIDKKLSSNEIRKRFLRFFEKRGHAVIPSSPLVPENDPSVLFNTAGMQPLVPYLLGQAHPKGKRLANSQKCVRTNDIEEVGDNTHFTFFEMLGNWSLGDYFKKEAINYSFDFLTNKKEGLGLEPKRLYVTVFEGNDNAPKDTESYNIWKSIFENAGLNPEGRIFWMGADSNWWAAGENGPCGPDSEMFYDRTKDGLGGLKKESFIQADDAQDIVEIWNDVFMEYRSENGKVVEKLKNSNVDTGAGLERLTAIIAGVPSPYETDMFKSVKSILEQNSENLYSDKTKDFRVIMDHIRTSVMLISDGVSPSNKDQGYILRRLLRRALVAGRNISLKDNSYKEISQSYISFYSESYPAVSENTKKIISEIDSEMTKFKKTLEKGLKEFEKISSADGKNEISGEEAFKLFATYGFPFEITAEQASSKGLRVDRKSFEEKLKSHSNASSTASAGKFKGGLGDSSPKAIAFHTATHLLLAGLKKYVGEHVGQKGSNVTEERTRFDFNNDSKVERDILDKVEDYVNTAISAALAIETTEMDKEEAKSSGVTGAFWEKYPDVVKVWTIKDKDGNVYSRELCGGPHVKNTADMKEFGRFKIKKEESSSAGVRRIKAVFVKD